MKQQASKRELKRAVKDIRERVDALLRALYDRVNMSHLPIEDEYSQQWESAAMQFDEALVDLADLVFDSDLYVGPGRPK